MSLYGNLVNIQKENHGNCKTVRRPESPENFSS